jgi:hypothetical protein
MAARLAHETAARSLPGWSLVTSRFFHAVRRYMPFNSDLLQGILRLLLLLLLFVRTFSVGSVQRSSIVVLHVGLQVNLRNRIVVKRFVQAHGERVYSMFLTAELTPKINIIGRKRVYAYEMSIATQQTSDVKRDHTHETETETETWAQ